MLSRHPVVILAVVVAAMGWSMLTPQAARAASACEYSPDYCYQPTADAGLDQIVNVGGYAYLDGSGTTVLVPGAGLIYLWSFEDWPGKAAGAPAPAFSDASAVNPSFQAARAGSYVIMLTVYNDILYWGISPYPNPGIV